MMMLLVLLLTQCRSGCLLDALSCTDPPLFLSPSHHPLASPLAFDSVADPESAMSERMAEHHVPLSCRRLQPRDWKKLSEGAKIRGSTCTQLLLLPCSIVSAVR